jgi:hypothetical protein
MARMLELSKSVVGTKFEFDKFEIKPAATKGKKITFFYLKSPIEYMVGSRKVDDGSGKLVNVETFGQAIITFHSDEWSKEGEEDTDGITVNPDGSGKVENDLILDVTENGDIQMRRDTLAAFGQRRRIEIRSERRSGAYSQMEENRAKYFLKKAAAGADGKPAGEVKVDAEGKPLVESVV